LQGNGTGAITGITGAAGQFPYYNGENTLLATSSIFLATSGNVGIGTTGPGTKLTVSGGTGNVIDVSGGQIAGLNSTPLNTDQAVPLGYLQSNYLSNSTASSTSLWSGAQNGNIWNGTAGAGNVGVGTTNPTTRLTVNGGGNVVLFNNGGTATPLLADATFRVANNGSANSNSLAEFSSSVGNVVITNAGNVGIGTTGPGATLHVNTSAISGSETLLKLQISDASTDYFQLANSTGIDGQFIPSFTGRHATDNRQALYFTGETVTAQDSGTTPIVTFDARRSDGVAVTRPLFSFDSYGNIKMLIDKNGNVGIGTTSPLAKLSIKGTGATTGRLLQITDSNDVEKVTILDNGNVG
ncbi:MAG: hypothetical protein Q7J73_10930, partial [Dehalococcoidales bacterium]|nr:hypothetical protein [Dehalococcoidales bacterium]